jgi:hypothetical protein
MRTQVVGFKLRSVDWLMCRSYSELLGALFGEGCGITLLLAVGRAFPHVAGGSSALSLGVIVLRATVLVVIASPFGVGAWWTVHTWRRLWRCGRSAWERLVYDYGVRLFGFSTAISIIAIVGWLGWTADSGALFGPMMILGALAGLFFGVPVALNLGYWWGSVFALIINAEHDSKVEIGEPPHLS